MTRNKRKKIVYSFLCLLLTITLIFPIQFNNNSQLKEKSSVVSNCSIFTVKDEDSVFFGSNEDEGGNRRRTDIWFVPPDDDQSFGCAYVGFAENEPGGDDIDGIAIGGINTEGLCFDSNGILPLEYVNYRNEFGPSFHYLTCWGQVLRECATVADVIEWYQTHNIGGYWGDQTHFADKTGDAVVVSPALDGSIAFTRINGSYLISTNFNVDHPGGTYYPCARYISMTTILEGIINTSSVSVESCTQVLEAVHVPSYVVYPGTVYSNVYDLKQQMIYLYIHGNFDDVVVLNLSEEIAKGYHGYIINDLADSTPEELFGDWNLWPIKPDFGAYSLSIILALITVPAIAFASYWIFVKRKTKGTKEKGGKKDGN